MTRLRFAAVTLSGISLLSVAGLFAWAQEVNSGTPAAATPVPRAAAAAVAPVPAPAASPAAAESEKLFTLIRQQAEAYNRKDIVGIMGTMHPKSPFLAPTEGLLKKVFPSYDLKYTVTDLTMVELGAEEARVSFTQTTEKINGPQFRNNRLKGIHVFKKDNGTWKLFETKLIGNVEYLDEK